MKKNIGKKFWIAIGVIVASVLLLWWLYAATLINEDLNELSLNVARQVLLRA